ncbi:hypothetical protein [uncultured Nostoc sp.]
MKNIKAVATYLTLARLEVIYLDYLQLFRAIAMYLLVSLLVLPLF